MVLEMNEFEIDKREVRRAFSKAAKHYDAAAVLQREICGRMLEKLDIIKHQPFHLLDIGSGTGWGTRQLGGLYPQADIVALDIAIGMLQAARGTSGWWTKPFLPHNQRLGCRFMAVVVEGAAHASFLSHAEIFVEQIRNFLKDN